MLNNEIDAVAASRRTALPRGGYGAAPGMRAFMIFLVIFTVGAVILTCWFIYHEFAARHVAAKPHHDAAQQIPNPPPIQKHAQPPPLTVQKTADTGPEPQPQGWHPLQTIAQAVKRHTPTVRAGSASWASADEDKPLSAEGASSSQGGGGAGPQQEGPLARNLRTDSFAATEAEMPSDRRWTINRGTHIKCLLLDRIVTTLPGGVTCRVLYPGVYSSDQDHSNRLIPPNSLIQGTIENGLLPGQHRANTIWTEIDSPDGAQISFKAPGGDSLGATGIRGVTNDKTWANIKNVVMESLILDAGQGLSNSLQRNNGFTFNNTTQGLTSAASGAVGQNSAIPPSSYINPGKVITITTVQPMLFHNVYEDQGP